METIIQQLKDYCDCFPELDSERPEDVLDLERNVRELINYISSLTCWAKNTCETFLLEERKQLITLDEDKIECCRCNDAILEVCLAYDKIDPETLQVSLIQLDGINKTEYNVSSDEFLYDDEQDILRLNLGAYISTCSRCICDCRCKRKYTIKLTYEAGYEVIPECLLGMFCDMLHVVYDKNKCSCERCTACEQENNQDIALEYDSNDQAGPKIRSFLATLVVDAYKNQLGYLTICDKCPCENDFWGFVV